MTIQARTPEQKLSDDIKQRQELEYQTMSSISDDEHNLQRIRAIRQDNLMKLWAVHSIINDKPNLLVGSDVDNLGKSSASGNVMKKQGSSHLSTGKKKFCTFCHKNGEPAIVYEDHSVKNWQGHVTCPILRRHKCEICGATGKYAHTIRHCPEQNGGKEGKLPVFRVLANGAITSSHNHK
ncbi:uncharacterized protein nanos [Atheta coriaria]|uniref:uncharacterized protein nanos n=1 Tax=Dalotia coriaria TaxID=877792 RepID=UPI0031F40AE5